MHKVGSQTLTAIYSIWSQKVGEMQKKQCKRQNFSHTSVSCFHTQLIFMLDLLWHLNFHCNWKRVWAVINVVHVIKVDWPERSWDPPAARVATQTQAQIWGDDGGEGVFKFPYIWWKGLLYTGVYQKQLEITGSPDPPISSVCWKFGCGSKIIGSNALSNGCNCIPVSFSSLGLMVGKLLSYPEIWRG